MIRPVNAEKINLNLTYKPGYIHPEFKPYVDRQNNGGKSEFLDDVDGSASGGNVDPTQIRKNKSYDFKPLGLTRGGGFCPANFTKVLDDKNSFGYERKRNTYKCVYDRTKEVDRTKEARVEKPTPTSSFDMRSVNPYTGNYDIYFKSKNAQTTQKYMNV
jgi:hypothetical protein